ncbi:MAG: DUF4469 domain-containing protein [Treponema sp.]|jgi:hypothetical protein|nr:DUF4469 domain-containing protein [Treponema sp.]
MNKAINIEAAKLHTFISWSFAKQNSELSGAAGQPFAIEGHKIKAAGESPDCGVYFISAANPSQRVKVAGHLADNTASRIVGIIPALAAGQWRAEVVTQFTGSGSTALKNPRTISGAAVLTVA